jgi:heat shock protein HslJ
MHRFAFATAIAAVLSMTATTAPAQDLVGSEWRLLAIDGQLVEIPATLRVEENGAIGGKAPCNGYSARNSGTLPELKLLGIRSTKMACDRLAEEQIFFAALAAMERMETDGPKNLILTGPDGRRMEFVLATVSSLPDCKTCTPGD